ncbi:hypothetical protein J26TS2_26010 [Shouchella clausii]|nr:hypothetical protein J26TS2_26010 [Shouchella clausii]
MNINFTNTIQGDEIKLQLRKDGTRSFKKQDALEGIDREFLDGMQDLFNNNNQTLQNLVDR